MSNLEAFKWTLRSQQLYRLAVFRIDKSRTKLVTDNVQLLLSLAIIGVVVAELAFCGYQIHLGNALIEHNQGKKTTHLMVLIIYLEFALTIICGMYFLVNAILKRYEQMNLFEKIQKIDDTIRRNFGIAVDFHRFGWVAGLLLLITLVYYNVIVTVVVCIPMLRAVRSINAMVILLIYILQAATSGVFTHGFISCVMAIYVRVVRLNGKLETIVRYPPEQLEQLYQTKSDLCMEMMRFTKAYKQLCSCVEDLNRIYGFSLVLHFTHDFTLLTSQIFMVFYVSYYEEWADSKLKILGLVIWMIPNIIKITFICFVCHVTRNEVNYLLFQPFYGFYFVILFLHPTDRCVQSELEEIQQRSKRGRPLRPRGHVLAAINPSEN
jgi:hypothetical protein